MRAPCNRHRHYLQINRTRLGRKLWECLVMRDGLTLGPTLYHSKLKIYFVNRIGPNTPLSARPL